MSTQITDDKECPTFLLDAGEKLRVPETCRELRPTKLHIFPEGTIKNEPSFAIELKDGYGYTFYAQISLEKFLPAFNKAMEVKLYGKL